MKNINEKYKEASKRLPNKDVFPTVDVKEYLISKGVQFDDLGTGWLRMRCLFPEHEDKHPSFFINIQHGGFNCYGCNQSGSWVELCKRMRWKTKKQKHVLVDVPSIIDMEDVNNSFQDMYYELDDHNVPKPKVKKVYGRFKRYLKRRNLLHFIDEFDIKCCDEPDEYFGDNYVGRLLFPIHDEISNFLFYDGRTIFNQKEKYWRPQSVKKHLHLFNLHRVVSKFGYKRIIVVEGIIDAMVLYYYGFPAVACFGSRISDEQISIMMPFGEVVVQLDNDTAGIAGWLKVKNKLIGTGAKVSRVLLPKGKDVNDLNNRKEYRSYYLNRKVVYPS